MGFCDEPRGKIPTRCLESLVRLFRAAPISKKKNSIKTKHTIFQTRCPYPRPILPRTWPAPTAPPPNHRIVVSLSRTLVILRCHFPSSVLGPPQRFSCLPRVNLEQSPRLATTFFFFSSTPQAEAEQIRAPSYMLSRCFGERNGRMYGRVCVGRRVMNK